MPKQVQKSLRSRRNADDKRHADKPNFWEAEKEPLHKGLGLKGGTPGRHAPMSFVYDDIKAIRGGTRGVRKRCPNRVFPTVTGFGQ